MSWSLRNDLGGVAAKLTRVLEERGQSGSLAMDHVLCRKLFRRDIQAVLPFIGSCIWSHAEPLLTPRNICQKMRWAAQGNFSPAQSDEALRRQPCVVSLAPRDVPLEKDPELSQALTVKPSRLHVPSAGEGPKQVRTLKYRRGNETCDEGGFWHLLHRKPPWVGWRTGSCADRQLSTRPGSPRGGLVAKAWVGAAMCGCCAEPTRADWGWRLDPVQEEDEVGRKGDE